MLQRSPRRPAPTAGCCRDCVHFCNEAAAIEAAFRGMPAMGSAQASVRADDGLCGLHEVYLACTDRCALFTRTASGSSARIVPPA